MINYKSKKKSSRPVVQVEQEILAFLHQIPDVDERGRMLDIYVQIRAMKRKG